jgi:hypothetical protein
VTATMKDVTWSNDRPTLTVEHGSSRQLGNCYRAHTYVVTTTRVLDCEEIKALRNAGVLGCGQQFYIEGQQIDGKLVPVPAKLDWESRRDVRPSGIDKIAPRVRCRQTGAWLNEQPVNAYTGKPITDEHDAPFYVYVVEDRVDSGD